MTVNNFANITASAGWGIDAFNYGNGDVTVNDNYGTGAVASTTVSGAQYRHWSLRPQRRHAVT